VSVIKLAAKHSLFFFISVSLAFAFSTIQSKLKLQTNIYEYSSIKK